MDIVISAVSQRTGSTLLQRILNQRKQTLIWGEHGGVLTNFVNIYDTTSYFSQASEEERKEFFSNRGKANIWTANITPEISVVKSAIIQSVKVYFDNLYNNFIGSYDLIGFKEVRYGKELELLFQCYPEIIILLLVRNPVDIWKSIPKFEKEGEKRPWAEFDEFIKQWNTNTSFYLEYVKKFKRAHLIKYENIVNKDKKTVDIICEIGKLAKSEFDTVLRNKIYSTRKEISYNVEKEIINNCIENMKIFGYI